MLLTCLYVLFMLFYGPKTDCKLKLLASAFSFVEFVNEGIPTCWNVLEWKLFRQIKIFLCTF